MRTYPFTLATVLLATASLQAKDFYSVTCDGIYLQHLQGICADEEAIYWSFTAELVKTDWNGKLLKKTPVASHHGDLCCHDSKLYIAVNLGKFNDPQGNADSWVYVYDTNDLTLLAKHEVSEVIFGAGGIAMRDGHFFVVGGLPEGIEENYVYEYDDKFQFISKHVVKSGNTLKGIQTATFANDRWWFGCYGDPKVLLVTGADFNLLGRYSVDCSLGIVGLSDGRFLIASNRREKGKGYEGLAQVAVADEELGLKITGNKRPIRER